MTVFVVSAVCGAAYAQQRKMDIASFNRLETDTDARIKAPEYDQNGELCALIKISSNLPLPELVFEGDGLGLVRKIVHEETGEIWLYLPRGARRISVLHNAYDPYRNYPYPDRIEGGVTYEMKIKGYQNDEDISSSNSQTLVLYIEPSDAKLFIDDIDETMDVRSGLYTATKQKGAHTYRVECDRYITSSGEINLGDTQVSRSISLRPTFGYISLISLPEEGASVFINDNESGITPYKSDRLNAGTYRIHMEKKNFYPKDTAVVVEPGSTVEVHLTMNSSLVSRKTLIMGEVAYNPSQLSYGVMIGMVKRNGGYIKARSDFHFDTTDLSCNDSGSLTEGGSGIPFYKEKSSSKSHFSVTAGYMRRIIKPLYLYAGAGYGSRALFWETSDGMKVKNTDHSYQGIVAEIGAITHIGSVLAISAGYQTIGFKYHEASVGIGVLF